MAAESAHAEPALAFGLIATIEQGGSSTFSIDLAGGTAAYGGVEVHLSFPDGISMASASKGALLAGDFTMQSRSFVENGVNKGVLLAYSESGGVGMAEGVLFTVSVQATADAPVGESAMRIESGALGSTLEDCAQSAGFGGADGTITTVRANTGPFFCASSPRPEETLSSLALARGDLAILLVAPVLLSAFGRTRRAKIPRLVFNARW